jgi:putative hydrolase of the HAD superfamily
LPIDRQKIRAVVFDYGNTLVEFTAQQVHALDSAIAAALRQAFGAFDVDRYGELRRRAYRSPYSHPELRESTIPELLEELVVELFGRRPRDGELEPIIAVHDEQFVKLVEAPRGLHELLERLRRRYRLALVSNYPCGRSIRGSLRHTGIERHLDGVLVSGEVGHVKPHRLLFSTICQQLDVAPHEGVFVGDNWFGDVQGAKRFGMWAVHTVQFDTLEVFDREPGHHDADLTIRHLSELETQL